MDYKFENTEGGQLLAKLRAELMECIEVPNGWLPEEFHDDVRGCRTLARLDEMCETLTDTETEHQKMKALKARNVERLRKQVEEKSVFKTHKGGSDFVDLSDELDYSDNESNEIQLHKNMLALVSGMVNGGLIDLDDLEIENG